ncbi:MAG: LysR family transcriptional regulator [Lachnospiraceae bacterium]|nr:LysR family transcriptional regulator [Lachnospiraceae bacterium]
MDTEKYKILLKTIETGSLSDAADALGYTPSGVSRAISSLEEESDIILLNRTHSGVTPTKECEELLPAIIKIVRQEEEFNQMASQLKGLEKGEIVIGTAYNNFYPQLSKLIFDFTRKYPDINVSIVEGTSSQLVKMVENNAADFCVVSKRKGQYHWVHLLEDELVAWVSKNSPLAQREVFNIKDFEKEPFIDVYTGQETDNSIFFDEKRIKPNVKYRTHDPYSAYSMVEAGLGVTLMNKIWSQSVGTNVVMLPLSQPQIINIGIAMQSDENASPAAKRFIQFTSEHKFLA